MRAFAWTILLTTAIAAPGGIAAAQDFALGAISPTTERIVVDAYTGLAIDGFDPVAYFLDGLPRQGQKAFEAVWSGAVWRFANEGNRAAFVESPGIYAPQFGGHCALAASEGMVANGDPLSWTVAEGRLLLFRDDTAMSSWLAAPAGRLTRAEANWPGLEFGLAP